jgi:ribosomal protein S18 acetylase RimI-like enzyme
MLNPDTEIRRLSTCSFDQAVQIWNKGFEGYFVDLTLSLDAFVGRLHQEGLSPELSLVAVCDGQPAGFLLNGIGIAAGRKVAWNGGTGVSPEFRGLGVGKRLVAAALDLYAAEGVARATLEAIKDNHAAIALYQKFGYVIVDRLVFLESHAACPFLARPRGSGSYEIKSVPPATLASLEFYDNSVVWQNQWQRAARSNGEALMVSDACGETVGYALFKKYCDEAGRLVAIDLHQCLATPGRDDAEQIVAAALASVFAPLDLECHRRAFNLSLKNDLVRQLLLNAGFTNRIEQLHMVKTFAALDR